ncbi:MAG: hypothetical protein M1169_01530 [Firmicutes bacterium]|jgi:hypothetical protein|nr:hypothetical protein [Bacillota bacterium]
MIRLFKKVGLIAAFILFIGQISVWGQGGFYGRIVRYNPSTQMMELMTETPVPGGKSFFLFHNRIELGILFHPKRFNGELFGYFAPSGYFRKLKNARGMEVALVVRP